ncbi:hypothetical protein CGLAMM_07385 [Acetobacteraceae bacterium EV16G]|uniref:Uncharacterized protein n=1 Tax=Sorlinia euscelidii TaxID=3081148 RepID=A0ABU7U1Y2_9PROT
MTFQIFYPEIAHQRAALARSWHALNDAPPRERRRLLNWLARRELKRRYDALAHAISECEAYDAK